MLTYNPLVKEVKNDYTLYILPDFKKEMFEAESANSIKPSRTEVIDYIYESLARMGVPQTSIHQELDELSNDPDYIKVQTEFDTFWEDIQTSVKKLHERGIYPLLDTSKGNLLNTERHNFTKRLISKVLGLWKTRVVNTKEVTIPIKIFSIHSLKIKGSDCSYSQINRESASGSFNMQLFGIGGGGKIQALLELGSSIEAKNGNCYKITKKVKVKVEKCIELYKGKECQTYVKTTPFDLVRISLKSAACSG
jgi:hypothetical protein